MNALRSLTLLICLMVYAPSAHAIMVKFGTKDGPIVPPAPVPSLPVPQPYRIPAPVWEERSNDAPDPNAHWRPQLFVPEPRYTQIIYNLPPPPLTNAQRFVNSYVPNQQGGPRPVKADPPKLYFTPAQVLSSQSLPGYGLRYFVPTYLNDRRKNSYRQEDAKQNQVVSNDVYEHNEDSASDAQWKYEKDLAKRVTRTTERLSAPLYHWPVFVPSRQH